MSRRPYVICHMAPSIDGRIVVDRWRIGSLVSASYERLHGEFEADAWMIGRVSMDPFAGKARVPVRKKGARIPRRDFIARSDAKSFAIALDPSGKLRWEAGSIDDDHVITVLTERVSDDYLAFLQAQGVSYVFGGKTELDLKRVLSTLRREFGIGRLLLEGGGGINGSLLAAGLIDELSVLVAPIADGSVGTPTLFDSGKKGPTRHLKLLAMERLEGDLVWLRYAVKTRK